MTATATTSPLNIDIVSDVVCPWCYIGKRHVEAAIAQFSAKRPEVAVTIRWHPFQLNPDLPPEGTDRKAYLEAKFGGPQRAAEIYARVGAAGRNAGLALNFDGIQRQPNTLMAHALIAYAQSIEGGGHADAIVERLFKAYFVDGRFVGDIDVLVAIAAECGLDAEATRAVLSEPSTLEQIAALDASVRRQGISGVPFLIFNQKLALSGAQPPEVMLDAMTKSLA
ncbi:MAG TPA: DsbA family oxidoreductase [Casimicrobium huifangae]|nr:DsbA family oxidoreductase [Casimicrobium huifangae]HQA33832.1 DsbA family oxidoreductase [Casimicrobium huifangae]